jgi:hypothetical protein
VLTRLEWAEFEFVSPLVLTAPSVTTAPALYIVAEISPEMWEAPGSKCAEFLLHPETIGDFYLTDPSFSWCIAKTHDDQLWLLDPTQKIAPKGTYMAAE